MKQNSKPKILILDANSSQCLPFISKLKSNFQIILVSRTLFSAGFFLSYKTTNKIWSKEYRSEETLFQKILEEVKKSDYKFVLSCSDRTSKILSENKKKFSEYTNLFVPDFNVFKIAMDKENTMDFCLANNIPCPKTYTKNDIKTKNISFPLISKPKIGVGSIGFKVWENEKEFEKMPKEEMSSLIIQDYIPNDIQFTVEAFSSKDSVVKSVVISHKKRFYPGKGGTSTCNVSVVNKKISSTVTDLLEKLKWVGFANVDIILDPRTDEPVVIEINPRIGATIKLAFISGVDFSSFLLNENISPQFQYKDNVVLRNLMLDGLWGITNIKLIFQKQQSYWKLSNTSYQFIAGFNPLPLFVNIMHNIIKQLNN